MLTTLIACLGIMSAMPQEGALIEKEIQNKEVCIVGSKKFIKGTFDEKPVVFCLSGVGKVSSALTATLLIEKFKVDRIVFTGVAAGGDETEIGDIVIGDTFVQHDLDLTPLFPQFYIYSLNKQVLDADKELSHQLKMAANRYLQNRLHSDILKDYTPKVHMGLIASGDQFIFLSDQVSQIRKSLTINQLRDFSALEMEGASVAQVCHELGVSFAVIRAISDKANSNSSIDFPAFIDKVASQYSLGILKEYLSEINDNAASW